MEVCNIVTYNCLNYMPYSPIETITDLNIFELWIYDNYKFNNGRTMFIQYLVQIKHLLTLIKDIKILRPNCAMKSIDSLSYS